MVSARPPGGVDAIGLPNGQSHDDTTDYDLELDSILGHVPRESFGVELHPGHSQPRAKWYHAAFHTVCAMVGAGVLGLPYAFSYLGWAAGLTTLTVLTAVSIYTSYLLAAMHENVTSRRLNDYQELGRVVLGPKLAAVLVSPIQTTLLVGLCITYSIAAGENLRGLLGSDCEGAECSEGIGPWILAFACLQLLASQLPDIHAIWWVSAIGAGMSLVYVSIAAALSFLTAASGDHPPGALEPRTQSAADTVFGIFNALGSIGFTFGGQGVLPEIQATLSIPSGRSTTLRPMMISVGVAYVVIVLSYYAVASAGYAAYGQAVAADVLLSLRGPRWLRKTANAAVVVHMAAAYQVFAQPIFALIEARWRAVRLRDAGDEWALGGPAPLTTRLWIRSAYVAGVTAVALVAPFFAEVMGIISSLGLIPMSFILPCIFWLVAIRPRGWERALNIAIAAGCSLLALLSLVGSVRNIALQLERHA